MLVALQLALPHLAAGHHRVLHSVRVHTHVQHLPLPATQSDQSGLANILVHHTVGLCHHVLRGK